MGTPDERLQKLFEEKKRILAEHGHYTHRQLEDAFHQRQTGTYLKDFIFGANDGIVTTFAVVAGAAGAGLSNSIIIILGVANLVADGLSMGLGNYLGERSEAAYHRGQREKEFWEVDRFPDIEEHEIREILRDRYGFSGSVLDRAVETLKADRGRWVEFMMREELDIVEETDGSGAAKHGFAMFLSFVAAGVVPLVSFLIPPLRSVAFPISLSLAGLTFFIIGSLRAKLSPTRWWLAGLEVFLVGSVASAAAYLIGKVLERIVG